MKTADWLKGEKGGKGTGRLSWIRMKGREGGKKRVPDRILIFPCRGSGGGEVQNPKKKKKKARLLPKSRTCKRERKSEFSGRIRCTTKKGLGWSIRRKKKEKENHPSILKRKKET